jgi:hypothetical protein
MTLYKKTYGYILWLALIDGGLVGTCIELLYKVYDAWEWKRADEYAFRTGIQIHVDRVGPSFHNRLVIPLLFVGAFVVSALFLRWLLSNCRISQTAFLQLTAICGVTIALVTYFSRQLRVDLSFIAQPNARYDLLGRFFTWLACVLIAGAVTLIFGIIIQHLSTRYFGEAPASY